MNSSSSFLDLLFILLLATLAMLCDSTRLGAIDGAPAQAGGQGISPIDADEVVSLYVTHDGLIFDGHHYSALSDLPDAANPPTGGCILLIPADQSIAHHRVITVWTQARQHGWTTKLGVMRRTPEP